MSISVDDASCKRGILNIFDTGYGTQRLYINVDAMITADEIKIAFIPTFDASSFFSRYPERKNKNKISLYI